MNTEDILSLYNTHKETSLYNRYITNNHIEPLLEKYKISLKTDIIGKSVLGNNIHMVSIGNGDKKILMWSQMHGNESTTTKAIFDLLNTLLGTGNDAKKILDTCTIYIIPILNPDGANVYTRVNANNVDLNRDAQTLSQPESIVLRNVFNDIKPHYCYNLHGQRTIFSAGNTDRPATVSFLAPAQDIKCTITNNRKVAMEVICVMNKALQELIPNQVGVYDDAFNLNCVGDTFQNENVPTILFEAGHYQGDYEREQTRMFIYTSILVSLNYIATHSIDGKHYESYFDIPENQKCFFDIIIRNAKIKDKIQDIGILYQEKLIDNQIKFIPKIEKIGDLHTFFGHKEFNANGFDVLDSNSKPIELNYENDFVIINNQKMSLLLK